MNQYSVIPAKAGIQKKCVLDPCLRRGDIVTNCLLVLAAALPLAFGPWLYDMYVLPKLLAASWFLMTASLTLRTGVGASAVDFPLAALGIAALVSSLVSMDPWLSWVGSYWSYAHGALGWALCGAAFFVSCSVQDKDFPERLARWMIAGSLPVSIYALFQKAFIDFSWSVGAGASRVYSTFGGPMHLGAYLIIVIPLALHSALKRPFGNNRDSKLGAVALFLGGLALAATKTRGAWLGAIAGVGTYIFLQKKSEMFGKNGKRNLSYVFSILAVLCVLLVLYLGGKRTRSDLQRLETWRSSVVMFLDHPWVGVGPDAFVVAFRRYRQVVTPEDRVWIEAGAHNDWLQVLATLGLAGFAAYAWLHAEAIAFLARSKRCRDGTFAAMTGSLAAVFVYAKLNVAVWAALFLSALLAGCLLRQDRQRTVPGRRMRAVVLPAICFAAVAGCTWLAWADREEMLGTISRREGRAREAAVQLNRAVGLNPWETRYRQNLDNLLWDAAASAPDLASRRMLLRWAAEAASGGIRRRPADAMAYFLLGRAELRRFVWGGEDRLEPARAGLEAARRLDPGFRFVQEDLDFVTEIRVAGHRRRAMGPYLSAADYGN